MCRRHAPIYYSIIMYSRHYCNNAKFITSNNMNGKVPIHCFIM